MAFGVKELFGQSARRADWLVHLEVFDLNLRVSRLFYRYSCPWPNEI